MSQSSRGLLNKHLGAWGEDVALAFLQAKGLTLLARNYRTKDGEIDLVMQDGETLVFVEVKTRRNAFCGYPEEAVTEEKLEHLIAAAEKYLEAKSLDNSDCRFDVVAVLGRPNVEDPQVEWYENVG